MGIQRFKNTDEIGEMLPALEGDGVIIIERALPDATVDALMVDVAPHLAECTAGGGEFFGGRCKRLKAVAGLSDVIGAFLTQRQLLDVSDHVLLPNCANYRVQVLGIFDVWPGGELQPLHRDTGVYEPFVTCGPEDKPIVLSFIWALSDFTAANGATRVVLGSHKWSRGRAADVEDVEQAEMAKGSVLIYFGTVLHGMGKNITGTSRTGLVSGFSVGWLRQEENQYLTTPPEVAARLPLDVQQLLGYRAHSGILGVVLHRDPAHLLSDSRDVEASGHNTVKQHKQSV
jgi:ectoine hydroxylase-related dioxygenase (phytanoyl-CoA dioxygenase family)